MFDVATPHGSAVRIEYEIESTWNSKKGLVGVYVHRLKDLDGNQASKGSNPFEGFTIGEKKKPLTSVVKAYNPPYADSKDAYNYISENLADWIEEAIEIRNNFKA